jgi:hypothetical protein
MLPHRAKSLLTGVNAYEEELHFLARLPLRLALIWRLAQTNKATKVTHQRLRHRALPNGMDQRPPVATGHGGAGIAEY